MLWPATVSTMAAWTYNLTVHVISHNKIRSSNDPWHEAIGDKRASEVASCLFLSLSNLTEFLGTLKLYSNTCGSQYRYMYVLTMLCFYTSHLAGNTLSHFDQEFLEPGHTHSEYDTCNARIEKAKNVWYSCQNPTKFGQRCARSKIPMVALKRKIEELLDWDEFSKQVCSKPSVYTENRRFTTFCVFFFLI